MVMCVTRENATPNGELTVLCNIKRKISLVVLSPVL